VRIIDVTDRLTDRITTAIVCI